MILKIELNDSVPFRKVQSRINFFSMIAFVFIFAPYLFAQEMPGGNGIFGNQMQTAQGDSISVRASKSPDLSMLGGDGTLAVGEFQFRISHNDIRLHNADWPQNFQQTSLTIKRAFMLENEKILIINAGLGLSGEKNSNTYSHTQIVGQLMYMVPPSDDKHWGYMAGLMAMPNSPFGGIFLPMLAAIYAPDDSFRLMVGFPLLSMNVGLWENAKFDVMITAVSIQRVAVKQNVSDKFSLAIAYKEELSRFGHIKNWNSNQILKYREKKVGIELQYNFSDTLTFGVEGGLSLYREYERISGGYVFNEDTIESKKYSGGYYGQAVFLLRF